MTTSDWAIVAVLAAYFVGVGSTDIVLVRRAARRVRDCHPETWRALGVKSPHTLAFIKFIRGKSYLSLNDPELTALMRFKNRFDNITGLSMVIVLLVIVAWARGMVRPP